MTIGAGTLGLLIKMLADITDNLADALWRQQGALGVDGRYLLVLNPRLHLESIYVVYAKRQDVLVVDGIDDGVSVQLGAKGLLGSAAQRVAAGSRVLRKDRRAGKTEQVVALKDAGDFAVHVAELAAVALVENHHHMRVVHRVLLVLGHEARELLDSGDDDPRVRVFQLLLQH
ncbi:hypothetical protein D3C73_1096440 [compost metagenome]